MTTRDRILAIRERNPTATGVEMAREIGLSRQRIQQVLVKLGLPTEFPKYNPCKMCDTQVPLYPQGLRFCSQECKTRDFESRRTSFNCEQCGKEFKILTSAVKARRKLGLYKPGRWCSHKCGGAWLGVNVGFPAHGKTSMGGTPKQSHCKRGHELKDPNLYHDKGGRHCRTCRQLVDKNRYRRLHGLPEDTVIT